MSNTEKVIKTPTIVIYCLLFTTEWRMCVCVGGGAVRAKNPLQIELSLFVFKQKRGEKKKHKLYDRGHK